MPGFTPSSFDFHAPVDSTGPEITSDVGPTNPATVSFHGGVRFDGATSDTVATAQIAPRTVRPSPFSKATRSLPGRAPAAIARSTRRRSRKGLNGF